MPNLLFWRESRSPGSGGAPRADHLGPGLIRRVNSARDALPCDEVSSPSLTFAVTHWLPLRLPESGRTWPPSSSFSIDHLSSQSSSKTFIGHRFRVAATGSHGSSGARTPALTRSQRLTSELPLHMQRATYGYIINFIADQRKYSSPLADHYRHRPLRSPYGLEVRASLRVGQSSGRRCRICRSRFVSGVVPQISEHDHATAS